MYNKDLIYLRKTIKDLLELKLRNEKIVALTAYDFQTAQIIDEFCDFVLVGDSLGNVFQGKETTLSVTLDEIIYHAKAVNLAIKNAHFCVDMPFMSYQSNVDKALENIGRVMQETNAQSVKIEMNEDLLILIKKASNIGIPIVAHVGLCPQSYNIYGGYKKQGKSKSEKDYIYNLAIDSFKNGASLIVTEGIPEILAEKITKNIDIPTIGIGAGSKTDGQILVTEDMLGITPLPRPSFVKSFANLRDTSKKAILEYKKYVKKNKSS